MADFGIYTKNADIQAEAGTNANTTEKATAATDIYVLNVESSINVLSNFNWSDAFSGLNADVKGILTETGACICANKVIKNDMSGFTSRGEAEDMISINRDTYLRNLSLLKNKNRQDFINAA